MVLYRGVSFEMYVDVNATEVIQPRDHTFEIAFHYDNSIKYDGSVTFGPSTQNAVVGHQIDSEKFRTSGISTTPDFSRAEHYALNGKKNKIGYVLVFDTSMLNIIDYELFIVSKYVKSPTCPIDEEVILKRKDNKGIPLADVFEIVCVRSVTNTD